MGRGARLSGGYRGPRHRGLVGFAVAATAAELAACGGGGAHLQDEARPPVTVDLSVYIDNHNVSVSPAKLGAGPVILYVTNQASSTETLAIDTVGGSSVASSGHITSGSTAQVTANLTTGNYAITSGGEIPSAKLEIGQPRQNADNVLLQP